MTPDEEAALRKCILDAQFRAARSERKGSNTSRPDDPSWHFCARRPNFDHLCRLNIDQGLKPVSIEAGCG